MGDEGSKCQLSDIIEKLTIRQGQVYRLLGKSMGIAPYDLWWAWSRADRGWFSLLTGY